MPGLIEWTLMKWIGALKLTKQKSVEWHQSILRGEVQELKEAVTFVEKVSETSDIFFTIGRAKHDGHAIQTLPTILHSRHVLVYAYMIGKFSLRWSFYRMAAYLSGAPNYAAVHEVINPAKNHKLEQVAKWNGIEPEHFKKVCHKLKRFWPLLP